MNTLFKTALLITMAVATWKVWKIEKNTRNADCALSVSLSDLPELTANSIASI
ncbi:TPA: hypothetical protein QC974_002451 [Staphylococcus aureus]|nr:hypothetical protein [Staphylococcus aureus]